MNEKFKGKAKRLISGFVAAATAITMLPAIPAMAEELGRYPYTLFAGSSSEGAITTTASNFGVNGNVATNGTISAAGNMNINGTKTENAGLDMIYIFDKIDSKYFSGNNVEEHTEDYVLDELNINISEPTEILGEAELTGNININTALKAFKDVTLNGEVKNTNDSVIYSKYGDIVIDSTNVNLNGLVYAPFGSVEVKAMNLNLNNVVIIADSIVFDCPNVNANYSTNVADFVGTVAEPLNIPKDEWQYMKDENENGLPDLYEDIDNWEKLPDSDGDGLLDFLEEYIGTDPNNVDTDHDGLSDSFEISDTNTDPINVDTDDNGINDGDEDFDQDGLSNIKEFENKTNPHIADTDGDGLSDGDEVNIYGTDPLIVDTDGDGLDDGDEIVLGTNPLVQDTDGDGIIDSKEKIQQTFTHKVKNEDCAVTEVIVDMECTGNINRTTSVESVMNTDILCTDVVGLVGEPFEIETTSEFDKATLTFKIDKDKLGEIPFDNLLFLWYNEEENRFDELDTVYDTDNGTVSVVTTHFSKYMVVNRQAWFDNWRKIYERFENLSSKLPSITSICVDCSGSMSSNDPHFNILDYITTCYRDMAVQQFAHAMFDTDKTSIITFDYSAREICALTSDKNLLIKKAKFYSNGGTNANAAISIALAELKEAVGNKSIILMSDGDVNVSSSNIKIAKDNDIKIHTVALGAGADSDALAGYATETGGEFFIVKTSAGLEQIYDKLSANNQLNFDYFSDSDHDGVPDDIEISGVPMPNGTLVFLDPNDRDTDKDGLSDGDEVGKLYRDTSIPLSTPIQDMVFKFRFDVTSNPTKGDSDEDGIMDKYDPHKFLKIDVETPCLYGEYDPDDVNIHHMVKQKSEGESLVVSYRCSNCGYIRNVNAYYQNHEYMGYASISENPTKLDKDDFILRKAGTYNPLGSVVYDEKIYPISYLDVTDGRQWLIGSYKTVAIFKKSKYNFDWVNAMTGNLNTTDVPVNEFIQYDAAGNKIHDIKSDIVNKGYNKANGFLFTSLILDLLQQGSETYNLSIALKESSSGECVASASFYITYPPRNGNDSSYTQSWYLGINEEGDLFFLNAWNKILDMEAGKVRER